MLISLVLGLIIGAISVIFALQNIFPVTVTFMVWEFTSSLAVLVSLAILMGIIICALISIPESIKNSFLISGLRKDNKKLSDELAEANRLKNQTQIITPAETVIVERGV